MINVIKSITVTPLDGSPLPDEHSLVLSLVPGTGRINTKRTPDTRTEEITLTGKLYREDIILGFLASSVSVVYMNDEGSAEETLTFGSEYIPASFTMDNQEGISFKCSYKRLF